MLNYLRPLFSVPFFPEMISRNKFRAVAFLAALFALSSARSKLPEYSMEEMTKSADIVVYGTVGRASNTPVIESSGHRVFVASMKIEFCFKRMVGPLFQVGNSIDFLYTTGGSEDPSVKPGNRYLLFLQESEVGPYPLNGIDGVLPVVRGKIETKLIPGEPDQQGWDSVKGRLLQYGRQFGCDDWKNAGAK